MITISIDLHTTYRRGGRKEKEKEKNPEMSSNSRQETDRSVEENSDASEYETNWKTMVDRWTVLCFHFHEHLETTIKKEVEDKSKI